MAADNARGRFFDPSVPAWGKRASLITLLVWLVLTPIFAVLMPKFSDATTAAFSAPSGTPSERAHDIQVTYFDRYMHSSTLVVVIERDGPGNQSVVDTSCEPVVCNCDDAVCAFTQEFTARVMETAGGKYAPLNVTGVAGYFSGGPTAAQLLSADQQATVVTVEIGIADDDLKLVEDFIDVVKDAVDDLDAPLKAKGLYVGVTGTLPLNFDAGTGTMASTEQVELFTFPIAFFVLACFIRSARLMIIPVLTIVLCIITSYSICYGVAQVLEVVTIAPALMMAATLAFNVDYNLFLLTRFRENKTPVQTSVSVRAVALDCVFRAGSTVVESVAAASPLAAMGIREGYEILAVNDEQVTCAQQLRDLLDDGSNRNAVISWRMSLWDNVWGSVLKHTASETVFLSGTLVTIAFLGMALIPLDALYGLGVCGGVSVFVCVVVNCTLSPAMLLTFGSFFAGPVCCCCCVPALDRLCNNPCARGKQDAEAGEDAPLNKDGAGAKKSMWFRLAELIEGRWAWVWVVVVIALGAPFWIRFPDNLDNTHINADPLEFAPRTSDSVRAWRRMGRHFDEGKFQPYQVICRNDTVDGADGTGALDLATSSGVYSPEGYAAMYNLVATIHNDTAMPMRAFFGPVSVPQAVPPMFCALSPAFVCGADFTAIDFNKLPRGEWDSNFALIQAALVGTKEQCVELCNGFGMEGCAEVCAQAMVLQATYVGMLRQQVSQARHAAGYVQVFTPFQPTGLEAMRWMDKLRPVFDAWSGEHPGVEIALAGGNAMFYDFNKKVNEDMPRMIGILLAAVFIIVCVVFRSVAIGAIMGLTIVFSVGVSFGVAYYIYQTDGFNWLFPYLDDYNNQGLNWSTVPMCFAITVALAMDYDVFILTRIYEIRRRGLSTSESVKVAMGEVSGTIAGAGCIMAIAFGGLMVTTVVTLNQFGVLLTVSILIDTFFMTTIVVPASMMFLGRHSWFPGQLWKEENASEDDAGNKEVF